MTNARAFAALRGTDPRFIMGGTREFSEDQYRLATVSTIGSTDPQSASVIFDGEDAATATYFPSVLGYRPRVGERVLMQLVNRQWLIVDGLGTFGATDVAWHEIGATDEPAFENSWVNYAGGYESAAYRIDSEGFVHLKGMVKSGTSLSATMFTLPAGYRPMRIVYNPIVSNNYPAYIKITPAGVVQAGGTGGPSTTWVSLDGVSFPAWTSWSSFSTYRTLSGVELRTTTDDEFQAGLIERRNGMVDVLGIFGPLPAAGKFMDLADLSTVYSYHLPVAQNTGAASYIQISNRLGAYSPGTTSSFSILGGEYGSLRIEDRWIDLSYQNSWVDYGNSANDRWPGAQYWKDSDGYVHLRGLVKSGTSATAVIATLPAGYRPLASLNFPVWASGVTQVGRITINNSGEIAATSQGSTTFTSLAGISFYADA